MTVAKTADVAQVQEALVFEKVQRELQAASKLGGLFEDFSSLAGKGASSVKVPRSDSFNVRDRDNATPTPATADNLTFAFDEIVLNKSKYVFYVIPGDVEIDAKPSYELTAASRASSAHARNLDIERINTLWTGADDANDVEYVSGTTDFEETVLELIEKADNALMLDDGQRYLIMRPSERKAALKVSNFVQTNRYGSTDPIMKGEIGQAYNVKFIVVNHDGDEAAALGGTFGAGKMILCHRESLGFAFHRQPVHDSDKAIEYGAGSMKHTWDVKYGLTALQDGALIVRAYDVV